MTDTSKLRVADLYFDPKTTAHIPKGPDKIKPGDVVTLRRVPGLFRVTRVDERRRSMSIRDSSGFPYKESFRDVISVNGKDVEKPDKNNQEIDEEHFPDERQMVRRAKHLATKVKKDGLVTLVIDGLGKAHYVPGKAEILAVYSAGVTEHEILDDLQHYEDERCLTR